MGVAAGETKDPHKAIPKAIHTTVFRLVLFFIGSIGVMAALIPWHKSGVSTSPFVLVFQSIGVPFAADIMNFVVLTAVLSAANSGLYVCARMVWSLAKEDMISPRLAQTNTRGVPCFAVIISMVGSMVCLLSSVYAADSVYLVLVAVSGLATLVVWAAIVVCQVLFRRQCAREGKSVDDLAYKVRAYPLIPALALIMTVVALILILFDSSQRTTVFLYDSVYGSVLRVVLRSSMVEEAWVGEEARMSALRLLRSHLVEESNMGVLLAYYLIGVNAVGFIAALICCAYLARLETASGGSARSGEGSAIVDAVLGLLCSVWWWSRYCACFYWILPCCE